MHYATKYKKEIENLRKRLSIQHNYRYDAITTAQGYNYERDGRAEMSGNEEGCPTQNIETLRKIIINWPHTAEKV